MDVISQNEKFMPGYFVKMINREKNHRGMIYKLGHNSDIVKFNSSNQPCCEGGLYFTTYDNIFLFMDYGITVAEIRLYLDSRIVTLEKEYKFRTDKFFIEQELYLYSSTTFQYLIKKGSTISENQLEEYFRNMLFNNIIDKNFHNIDEFIYQVFVKNSLNIPSINSIADKLKSAIKISNISLYVKYLLLDKKYDILEIIQKIRKININNIELTSHKHNTELNDNSENQNDSVINCFDESPLMFFEEFLKQGVGFSMNDFYCKFQDQILLNIGFNKHEYIDDFIMSLLNGYLKVLLPKKSLNSSLLPYIPLHDIIETLLKVLRNNLHSFREYYIHLFDNKELLVKLLQFDELNFYCHRSIKSFMIYLAMDIYRYDAIYEIINCINSPQKQDECVLSQFGYSIDINEFTYIAYEIIKYTKISKKTDGYIDK